MDRYRNFEDLAAREACGVDFRVRARKRSRSAWAVIAPHGGGIEPGTSEVADAVAGNDFSFCAFEGLKRRGNADLHITSTRFDEPQALSIAAGAVSVLTIHGEASTRSGVFLGGRDAAVKRRLRASLQRSDFRVERHHSRNLDGAATTNICNRGRTGAGVQIELSQGLRRSCFRSLSSNGRKATTRRFDELVAAIRRGLNDGAV